MEDEDVYWGMMLGAAEMQGNGTTTTTEQYRHPEAVARGLLDAGIRAVYTPAIFDVPGTGDTWEALLEGALPALRRRDGWQGRARAAHRVRPSFRVHGAARGFGGHRRRSPASGCAAADPSLRDPGRVCRRARALRDQRAAAAGPERRARRAGPGRARRLARGRRPVRLWRRPRRCQVAHCARLQRLQLGSGAWRRWPTTSSARCAASRSPGHRRTGLERRSPPLGRDAPVRPAGPGHCGRSERREHAARRLRLATRGGADALGLPVGSLEVGRRADVIHLRTDDPRFTPATSDDELLGHLVWAGAGYLVTDVWVSTVSRVVDEGRPAARASDA